LTDTDKSDNNTYNGDFFLSLARDLMQRLHEEKAEDIVLYEMNNNTSLAYCSLVLSGQSTKHIQTMASKIMDWLREAINIHIISEGTTTGDWIVVYTPGIMIHLFMPDYRDAYDIENLWQEMNIISASEGKYERKRTNIEPLDLLHNL